MGKTADTFYMNIDTQERASVVWRVSLTRPTYTDGYVDVEGTTEAEAIDLALGKHFDEVEWDSWGDEGAVDVIDVECENPPVDCLLMNANR
jgi:hypothetical protein